MKQLLALFASFLLLACVHGSVTIDKVSSNAETDLVNLGVTLATMSATLARSNTTTINAVRSWSGNISEAFSAVRSQFINSGIDVTAFEQQIAYLTTDMEPNVPLLEYDLYGSLYGVESFANHSRDLLVYAATAMDNAATGPYRGVCLNTYARMTTIRVSRITTCVSSLISRVESVGTKVAAMFAAATPSDVAWINQIGICSQPSPTSTCVSNFFQNGFQSNTFDMGMKVHEADRKFIRDHLDRCVQMSTRDIIERIAKARSDFDNCLTTGV